MSDNEILGLILESMLPYIQHEFGQEYDPTAFEKHKVACKINFRRLLLLIQNSSFSASEPVPEKIIIFAILLCGEHSESNSWTDTECIKYANQILQKILEYSSATSVLSIMLAHKIQSFFNAMNPKLLKKTWKNYPAAISCFKWVILQVKVGVFLLT